MTDKDFHAQRTALHNDFAAAGAKLLEFMSAAGGLAAIPNTHPQQYAVAGDLSAIQALLPNRRERRGERPTEDLYFGPATGQPRRWAALITSAGHGVLQEYGSRFEHAQPGQEVIEVMEMVPGIANKAAEEGELPVLPEKKWHSAMGFGYRIGYYTDDQVKEYARQSIAADRASRQVANKAEVDPVAWACPLNLHGSTMEKPDVEWGPENNWDEKYKPFPLYTTPPATTGASTVLTDERIIEVAESFDLLSIQDGGRVDRSALLDFAREVAAQAGQVAVPEKLVADIDAIADELEQEAMNYEGDFADTVKGCAEALRIIAAPSPAKESK